MSVRALFPVAVGDRWRERVGTARTTRGVTALSANGLAVVFGQTDERPSFFSVTDDEVALATPDGAVVEPLLRAPLRVGQRWSYAIGEAAEAVACTAHVEARDAHVEALSLEGCLRVRRVCEHPMGGPFTVPTTRTTEETYCPGVGRVRSRTALDPPLFGAEAPSEIVLVAFAVAGAPAPPSPARFDCDGALLLPSDVQAACGRQWRWIGEETSDGRCVHRFSSGDEALEVRLSRRDDEEAARASLTRSFAPRVGVVGASAAADSGRALAIDGLEARQFAGSALLGAVEGPHTLLVESGPGCPPERAARLFPLLRSLVR